MTRLLQTLRIAPENRRLMGSIYFEFFTCGLMSIMLGSLLPYIRDGNGLSYSQSGMILSAHQTGNLCAVFVAGALPFVIGRRKSALILGLGSVAGLLLMAATGSLFGFFAAFALTGVGRGTMSNICGAVISEISDNKTASINLLHASFAVGALLSPVAVFFCTRTPGMGWKPAALVSAALSAAAWLFLARGGLSDSKAERAGGESFSFLKDGQFWLSTMILFFYLCAEGSIVGWFVVYFQDTGVLPPVAADFTPTLLWLMMLIGRVLCAAVSSRVNRERMLMFISVSFTVCFAGMLMSRSAVPCVIFLLGIGLSMAGIFPTTFATIRSASSVAASAVVIGTATVGAIVMPWIVGAVADVHGVMGGVATILASLVCMVVLVAAKMFRPGADSPAAEARTGA